MSINRVTLFGRLTRDPEIKYTATSVAVCNFSVACSENWMDKQGVKQERTEFINIEAWGKLGEICNQYLAKGRQAIVEGKIKTDMTEKDGQKRYFTKVNATNVQFVGDSKQQQAQEPAPVRAPVSSNMPSSETAQVFTDEDIPF